MKYWEIFADNLSKAGWSWGYVSAVDSEGAREVSGRAETHARSKPGVFALAQSV